MNPMNFFHRQPPRAPKLLQEILEDHYLAYSGIRPGTIGRYRCELRRWIRIVGDLPTDQLEFEHFHKFRTECLRVDLSPSSIEGSVKIVMVLLRFARDRGWLTAIPMRGKPLPMEQWVTEPATLAELGTLYETAEVARFPGRKCVCPRDWFRAFLTLEYWTGIRGSDLLWRFGWKHISADCIRFQQSKTSKIHVFPLHPVVEEHLKLVHGMDEDRVFACRSLQRVNKELGYLCEIAGIRKMTTTHIREACFTRWTLANETAGKLIHGCGIPVVLQKHYLGRLQILEKAANDFEWPQPMRDILPPELRVADEGAA